MTKKLTSFIEIKSHKFLKNKNIKTFPINLLEIVKKLKLDKSVEIMPAPMPLCVGGYTRREINGYYILVNKHHIRSRQRFSIAHEIGHLYLGHEENSVHTLNYWETHDDYQETSANEFAASILMPTTEIYKLADIYRCNTLQLLQQVQAYFEVSLSAAARRVTSLGIIDGSIILKDGKKTCFTYSSPNFPAETNYKMRHKKKLSSGKTLYVLVAETGITQKAVVVG